MSMAAKSSDLVDETSGVNLQTEVHTDMPPQSAKDLWSQKDQTVLPPTHHFGHWPAGCHPAALILNIA